MPVPWWALLSAAGIGMVMALAGVMVSSARAGRVAPDEALRDAAIERSFRAGNLVRSHSMAGPGRGRRRHLRYGRQQSEVGSNAASQPPCVC
ncbi:hypothetical protein [Streptomyces virginiae]